jgi:hypothetical protein
MAQTIGIKDLIFTLMPTTPSATLLGADLTLANGTNAVWTLPKSGPCLIYAFLKFKAVGTALALFPRTGSNNTLTSNFQQAIAIVDTSSNYITANTTLPVDMISDLAATAYFGLYCNGAPTGSYTLDYRYEYYPLQ